MTNIRLIVLRRHEVDAMRAEGRQWLASLLYGATVATLLLAIPLACAYAHWWASNQ